ncbi:FUSC family protein, partial [Escherichia sp. R-CC3]
TVSTFRNSRRSKMCHWFTLSQELHRLQSGVDDHARLARTSALARHTDNAEAMWSGLRTFCTLMMIGAWSIASQWDAGANALTLAAISCDGGVEYAA